MPVDDSRSLAHLLPHLASLLAEVPLDAPVAVGVVRTPAGAPGAPGAGGDEPAVEFLFRHLDCTDVVCALGGFVAPAHWDAFGVVAPGRGVLLDPAEGGRDLDVTVCALLDRAGLVASEVRGAGGAVLSHGDSSGRAVDVCRRVLGLATAPPLLGPHVWRTLRWLDRVLAEVLDADLGEPPAWRELHELRLLDERDERDEHDERAGDPCAPFGAQREWTWHELRLACAHHEIEVPGILPDTAAWMDDGLFAREAIGAFPPLVASLGDLRQLLPRRTFDHLVAEVSDQLAA